MSDYFSALLRSADARPVPRSAADNGQHHDPSGVSPGHDRAEAWGEETVQTDAAAGVPGEVTTDPAHAASSRAEPPTGIETTPSQSPRQAAALNEEQSASRSRSTTSQANGLPKGSLQIPGDDDPRVQAALRWIAAAPAATQDASSMASLPTPDERLETAVRDTVERRPASDASEAGPVPPTPGQPAARAIGLPRAAADAAAAASAAQGASRDPAGIQHSGDRDGRRPTHATAPPWQTLADDGFARARPARRAADTVEVHIGSIQLRVDAPPAPRVVAAPAPPAPAAAPARSAPTNSGWSRCRLPRL